MPAQSYGRIVVCGGGCYGGYYVRQLARARAAGALQCTEIIVVDRDPACRAAQLVQAISDGDTIGMAEHGWRMQRAERADGSDARVADADADARIVGRSSGDEYCGLPIRFIASDWAAFFARWFVEAIEMAGLDAIHVPRDAVVPSPLMPHLLADWVASRLVVHRAGAVVTRVPLSSTPETPWQRSAPDLAHYASFATWMCPINCIEPPRCPETRGPRDWTMPAAVRVAAGEAASAGAPYDVIALFHTTHRVYGVGMFDVAAARATDLAIAAAHDHVRLRVLVASVSHCHGALAELLAEAACSDAADTGGAEPSVPRDVAGLLP